MKREKNEYKKIYKPTAMVFIECLSSTVKYAQHQVPTPL